MRAHEFSRYLIQLARLLRRGPDFELGSSGASPTFQYSLLSGKSPEPGRVLAKDDIPVALNALLALSTIDKRDWAELIADLQLPISVRPRDASRDLLGKVLKFLEGSADAREVLSRRVRSKTSRASPELLRALSTLLK